MTPARRCRVGHSSVQRDHCRDGEGWLSAYRSAILGRYIHLIGDMLAVAHKHRDTLEAIATLRQGGPCSDPRAHPR